MRCAPRSARCAVAASPPLPVVDDDGVDGRVRRSAVDGDDRDAACEQRRQRRLARRRDRDDHTGHPFGDDHVDVRRLGCEILVRVAQHEPVVLGAGDVFDAADDRREERVLDVGDDRGPYLAALPAQRARRAGREIAESRGGVLHALGSSRRNGPGTVQRARDGRGRHVGGTRDVGDRGHSLQLRIHTLAARHRADHTQDYARRSGASLRNASSMCARPAGW